LPDDTGDVDSVLRYALKQEQRAIDRYGQLLERTRGMDPVTEHLLVSILSDKVAREDEIEAVLTQSTATLSVPGSTESAELGETPTLTQAMGSASPERDI
jgi:ferritin-like protein